MFELEYIKIKRKGNDSSSEQEYQQHIKETENIDLVRMGKHKFYEVCKNYCQRGVPDFYYEKDGIIQFIEVKTPGDGLSYDQLLWMKTYPQYKIKIVFVEFMEDNEMKATDLNIIFPEPFYIKPVTQVLYEIKNNKEGISVKDLKEKMMGKGITPEETEAFISKLKRVGEIFFASNKQNADWSSLSLEEFEKSMKCKSDEDIIRAI